MTDFNQSKLVALVKQLSPEDLKNMVRFLKSPYHNSNKRLGPFFQLICRHYPDFDNKHFTSEKIHKKTYPDRPFNLGIFQGLKADLTRKIQAYLAFEELRQDQQLKKNLSYRGHGRRNGYHIFRNATEQRVKEIEKKGNKLNLRDTQNLLNAYHHLFFHPQTDQEKDIASTYINNGMDCLDCFYFFSKVIYGAELLSQSKIKKQHYEIKLLDKAIHLGQQTHLRNNILFNLYVLAIELLKTEEETIFNKLKLHLFQNGEHIPVEGKMMSITVLINFAIAQINQGNAPYLQELFELNKFRDQANLFLKEDTISAHSFTNVIVNAAACGAFSWAAYFSEKYTLFIHKDIREDTLNLSNAFIDFHKQSYDKVLKSLVTIRNNNMYTNIRVRSLYIRAYYELSLKEIPYTEIAIKEVNNLKVFLRKNEIHKDKKEAYLNFCKICLAMLNSKPKKSIRQMIHKMKQLRFRIWLQNKISSPR